MQISTQTTQAHTQIFSTHMSSRGQVVIPKPIREAHSWVQNTEFVMHEHPLGVLLVAKSHAKKSGAWADLRGIANSSKRLSDVDLHAPVGQGAGDAIKG